MRELTQLVTEGRVDHHIGRMVNSVCELRSGNWGRSVSHGPSTVEPSTAINEQPVPHHLFNEPVLYGPDGTILSAEESNFCQSRATADEIGDDGGDGGRDDMRYVINYFHQNTIIPIFLQIFMTQNILIREFPSCV